ncbi:MAG: ABC transporter permease [Halobacteriales archaeon]
MATESPDVRTAVRSAASSLFDRREGSVLVGLIAILALGVFVDASRFIRLDNFFRILRAAATWSIIGYGVAILMVTGEFDLSVGSMYGVGAAMGALMIGNLGFDPLFTMLVVLAFALIFGITQGILVIKLDLPSLIVTIGTLTLLRGVIRIFTQGTTLSISEPGVLKWFGGSIVIADLPFVAGPLAYRLPLIHDEVHEFTGFSIQIVWIFVLLAAFHYILNYTRFGMHARATGDNIESVDTTGVDPEIIKLGCFGLSGLAAAFAGIAFLGRFGAVSSSAGSGLALVVIAAVVLGGTKLTGGEGSMLGVFFGALVLATANNVLAILGLNVSGWNGVITGGFIIAAIGLDVVLKGFSPALVRDWYLTPLLEIASSPTEFFRERSIQMTTDDLVGFFALSVGVTVVATNLLAWVVGLGVTGMEITPFKLFTKGNWPETAAQIYVFLMVLTLVALFAIEAATQYFDSAGDYENTLAVASYGTAPAPLFAVPIVMFGFKIGLVGLGGAMSSAAVLSVPILLLVGWVMYAGVREAHDLPSGQALAVMGATYLAWLLVAAVVALGLSSAG